MNNKPTKDITVEHMVREFLGLSVSRNITSEINEIAELFPENPNSISSSNAQFLAARFLKGMDLCAELSALAASYETKLEIQKRKAHGEALIIRSKNKGFKTAKEKEAYAYTDEEYVSIAEKHADAKVFRLYIDSKRKDFERAHYQMRKLADRDLESESASFNYDDSADSEDLGSDKWDEWLKDENSTNNSIKRKSW